MESTTFTHFIFTKMPINIDFYALTSYLFNIDFIYSSLFFVFYLIFFYCLRIDHCLKLTLFRFCSFLKTYFAGFFLIGISCSRKQFIYLLFK